jgi:hypothetical protein
MGDIHVNLRGSVGEKYIRDGAEVPTRLGNDASMIIAPSDGDYGEACKRGRLFYSHCQAIAMSAPATSALGNIIYNPPGSGVILKFLKWSVIYMATDADAQAIQFCYSAQAATPGSVTAATSTGNCYIGKPAGAAKAYSVATITTAATPIYGLAELTAAINTVGAYQLEGDFKGSIIIPPGYLASIHTIAAAASSGITTTLIWKEEPEGN